MSYTGRMWNRTGTPYTLNGSDIKLYWTQSFSPNAPRTRVREGDVLWRFKGNGRCRLYAGEVQPKGHKDLRISKPLHMGKAEPSA